MKEGGSCVFIKKNFQVFALREASEQASEEFMREEGKV